MSLDGTCHCGKVSWAFDGTPPDATACNCTICRRYGVLWAYDHEGERIRVFGPTKAYIWGHRSIGFHFCPDCGCVAYWRALERGKDGRRRIAVNLRLVHDLHAIQDIPLLHFDGLTTFDDLPTDGKCVGDVWF